MAPPGIGRRIEGEEGVRARRLPWWMVALGVALAQSQAPTGAIHGVIRDPSGSLVSGARIRARHQEIAVLRETLSDAEGRFLLPALPAGPYKLYVEKEGFARLETPAFPVPAGQTVEQRLTLGLAGVASSLEVQETPEALDPTATAASTALGGERIEEGPARARNYLSFVMMAPGLASSNSGPLQRSGTALRNPGADSGFSFSGLPARNNSLQIDGLDNRDEATGGMRTAVGLEMVQEFRVAGAVVGAELGGASGGLINVVTRTGSNQMHGDFTFFGQSSCCNAREHEAESAAKPRSSRRQPGASWYGPLRRDRSFLAAAFESERESAEEWSETPEFAAGRINAVLAQPLYAALPVRSVYRGLFPIAETGATTFLKWNHQANERNSLALRHAYSRGRASGDVRGPLNFQDPSAGGDSDTIDHSVVGNWFYVASAASVWETRWQAGRREQRLRPASPGPMLEIPGVITMGQGWRLNGRRAENHFQVVEAVDRIVGGHRLSLGADLHLVSFRARMAHRFGGVFIFPTLEDFESARPDLYLQAFGDAQTSMWTAPIGAWLQERWRVREGLNLEMGLRYDRQRMPKGAPPSGNQWSPRAGVCWKPWRRRPLVLRVGAGIFHDRFPLLFLNEAIQKDGRRSYEVYAAGVAAAAAYRSLLEGRQTALAPLGYRFAHQFKTTRSEKITAGAEYGLDSQTTFSIQGSWVRGLHLPRIREYRLEQEGRSAYHGLSISLHRRMSRELAFLAGYDLGRALDDGSDFLEQPMDPRNVRLDWAHSRQYQKHRLALSALIELPGAETGPAAPWLSRWTLSPIFIAGSGRPLNALLTTDLLRTGAYPLSARPSGWGRNPALTRAGVSLDARLMKTIPFEENRCRLQFGVESFNLLNRLNPAMVNEYVASPRGRLPNWGAIIESGNARQIQFFAQFEY